MIGKLKEIGPRWKPACERRRWEDENWVK